MPNGSQLDANYFFKHCLLINDDIFHQFDSESLLWELTEIIITYSSHRVKGRAALDNLITSTEKSLKLKDFRFLAVDIEDAPRLGDDTPMTGLLGLSTDIRTKSDRIEKIADKYEDPGSHFISNLYEQEQIEVN